MSAKKTVFMRSSLLALAPVLATLLPATPLLAQDESLPMPPVFLKAMEPMVERAAVSRKVVVTRHKGEFGGRKLAYDAIVSETPVQNAKGEAAAVVVTYAYVARDAGSARRPVLFVFNGGPGASSSPLHMNAFGPRRIVGKGEGAHMENNPHSLLDVADLVFIDPPGTGASMPVKGADATSLFSVSGDAAAVAQVVQTWRQANGRTEAPFALVGESYGTARALAMLDAESKAKLPLPDGVALFSLSLGDNDGPVISDVSLLPTLAAVAWYHQAINRKGTTVEQHFAAARAFAENDYARALIAGASLPEAERAKVAARISALIGLPASTLEKDGLQLDRQAFMLGLLSAKGLRTGQLDGRVTRAVAESNMHPPFDDPSMTLGAETGHLIADYIGKDLGYALPSAYRTLNLGINFKWDWGRGEVYRTVRFAPFLAKALVDKPGMKLMTVGGYYDITTPVAAGQFALDHAGIGPEHRTSKTYAAGHSVFEDEGELTRFATDMRAWAKTL
ncbi:peptidase S10 [Novosphingobium sp. ST904]|uniref:S10 family serine carboxypeptidase-like protein n=2 Tax=Novosphingobium sp. ST904 TaxID=1684385 RepID=UPI0006C8D574|nr:peptidase S10 [Novosphingobium sp. ST904]KPH63318.1 peptidase S10 [Novosphingobium sp. ST904]TCM40861.1 carboxypeptidase C (cathepsin A) [Novosphingobium sp. ST904]